MRRPSIILSALALTAAGLAAAACTMKKQEPPDLTGPSEFGTSITVEVSPDVITQDGASQAVVTITARNASSAPAQNVVLKAETAVAGVLTDFGTLSAKTVATGSDGRATLTYTAPAPVFGGESTLVDILVTPVSSNYANATPRSATVRLVPQGVVLPPAGLQAAFTFTPDAPAEGQSVVFDASSSTAPSNNPIAEYRWSFGDGGAATGRVVTHAFNGAGAFPVTLSVVDAFGRSASRVQTVQVAATSAPTALFVFSPASPLPGQRVNFNASGSTAASGRTLVGYRWDFGDGSSGSGVQEDHDFDTAGTYGVTLVVTDDAGRSGSTTVSVTVGSGSGPTAEFVFSPTAPIASQTVNFNASGSRTSPGASITSYTWDFGDGRFGTGQTTTHAYGQNGTYTVTLSIADTAGRTAIKSNTVTVGSDVPTASFTFSPASPTVGTTVSFDGSSSTAIAGRTITTYTWSFGDGSAPATGQSATHAYGAPGTYTVTLTVVDSTSRSASTTRTVTVAATP